VHGSIPSVSENQTEVFKVNADHRIFPSIYRLFKQFSNSPRKGDTPIHNPI